MSALLDRVDALLERTAHLDKPSKLEAEMTAARSLAAVAHAQRLLALGVPQWVVAELGGTGFGWGVVHAVEHPSEPGLYCLDPKGAAHLLLPVVEDGLLVDLVAFRSGNPNDWLLRTGQGWALGLESGLEPHAWEPAPLVLSPLEWLQGGCDGLCVLDWDAPEVDQLRDVPSLVCSSPGLASHLRSALSKPVRLPQISVMETRLAA